MKNVVKHVEVAAAVAPGRASAMTRVLAAAALALGASLAAPVAGGAQYARHTAKEKAPMKNVVQVAVDAGSFKTLVTAVKAADLAETLQGQGPFTVFAPTDAAFAKLPKGTVESLLADKEALASVLTYHVVLGRISAADIVKRNGARPETVNGEPLDIVVRDGKVFVNGAQVITADVGATNGVIHVIDSVLLPKPAPAPAGR
jgi:uncharacterized surface protein with fasciclin (FAS1) repeats